MFRSLLRYTATSISSFLPMSISSMSLVPVSDTGSRSHCFPVSTGSVPVSDTGSCSHCFQVPTGSVPVADTGSIFQNNIVYPHWFYRCFA